MRNSIHNAGAPDFLAQQNVLVNKNRFNPQFIRWLKALLIPIMLLIVCEFLVRYGYVEAYLLPAPSSLWQSFWDLAETELFQHIYISTWRVLLGFTLGSGIALIVAIWVGLSQEAEAYLDPTFSALKSIPSLAWIPLLLLWLGIDESSKITLIAIGAFFPTYTNTVSAIHNVDRKLIEVGKVYQLNAFQRVISIILPAASAGILTGLRNSLSLSWMFMIAAELIAATQGIGYLLSDGRETSRPDIVIIAIILLAFLGKISDTIMKRLENYLLRWRDTVHK